jgi:hypothetical protein
MERKQTGTPLRKCGAEDRAPSSLPFLHVEELHSRSRRNQRLVSSVICFVPVIFATSQTHFLQVEEEDTAKNLEKSATEVD